MARSTLLLTQEALAKRWHKDGRTIARWTKAGMLPTFTDPISGRVMYPLPAIERWEASDVDRERAS